MKILTLLIVFALLFFDTANAQISAPTAVSQDRVNGVSFGVSYGEHNDKDADFWGWSLGYSRVVGPRWVLAAAITWDEETERKTGQVNTVVKAFTAVGTVSYLLSDSFTLTTGLAKGIANDENSSRSMKACHLPGVLVHVPATSPSSGLSKCIFVVWCGLPSTTLSGNSERWRVDVLSGSSEKSTTLISVTVSIPFIKRIVRSSAPPE